MGLVKKIQQEIQREIISFIALIVSIGLFTYGELKDVLIPVNVPASLSTPSFTPTLIPLTTVAIVLAAGTIIYYVYRKRKKR